LIVGGHAAAFHGYPRFTQDFDLFISTGTVNAGRVLQALHKFGFALSEQGASPLRIPAKTFVIGVKPNRIDILTKISGVDFSEAWQGRVAGEFDGIPVFFIGRQELIEKKRSTGRLKDSADVEELTLIENGGKRPKKKKAP
jgi:hypothetical protein